MGKRLRRDIEDVELLASYNSQPVSATGKPKKESIEDDNLVHLIERGQPRAYDTSSHGAALQCTLPPHPPIWFSTQSEFETHYQKDHVTRCSACGKNFPTEHYLNLHIAENHDPINEVLKQNNERTYGCFVEGCDRKCSNSQKRRRHLIDKHLFPKDYDFHIINDGLDNRTSLLRESPRERKARNIMSNMTHSRDDTNLAHDPPGEPELPETMISSRAFSGHAVRRRKLSESSVKNLGDKEGESTTSDIDSIVSSMSALDLVPRSVRFRKR